MEEIKIEKSKYTSSVVMETDDINSKFNHHCNIPFTDEHSMLFKIKGQENLICIKSSNCVYMISKGDNNTCIIKMEVIDSSFFKKYFYSEKDNTALVEIFYVVSSENNFNIVNTYSENLNSNYCSIGSLNFIRQQAHEEDGYYTFGTAYITGPSGRIKLHEFISYSTLEDCWKKHDKHSYLLSDTFVEIAKIEEIKNLTVDVDRINMLSEEVLKLHQEENVSIRVSVAHKTVELVIRYPTLDITNEYDEGCTINDLIVSLPFNLNITGMSNLLGTRAYYTTEDIMSFTRECCDDTNCEGCETREDEDGDEYEPETFINNVELYSHSHLPGDFYENFSNFCLGDTPISFMFKQWNDTSMEFPYQIILRLINSYVECESQEGGPYLSISNRGSIGANYIYSTGRRRELLDVFSKLMETTTIPLKYVNKELIVDEQLLIQRADQLAKKKLIPSTTYGKYVNGRVTPRINSSSSNIEALEYIQEHIDGIIYFKEDRIEKQLSMTDSESEIVENTNDYGVFPNIIENLIIKTNEILKNEKFKQYANNELEEN